LSSSPPESAAALKARALRLLARREHSREELARKLSPHAGSSEILQGLLRELESKKQLSNERFAEERARWLARKYGAAKIRHDLKSKGVDEALAARATSGMDEVQKAREILARKYRNHGMTREERAKRARFLQSRGFSYETIRSALGLSGSINFPEE
jgi:regulatory protein